MDDLTVHERTLAKKNLVYFLQYKKVNAVVIFDRGYPSKAMFDFLHKNKIKYIIRYQKNHNKMIDNCDKNDFEVVIDRRSFRDIKLLLDSGEVEVLITNLSKSAFLFHDFKELYHLRWAIETKYDTLKNKLEIETFSGKTVNSFFKDFYATLYMANISAAIKLVTDTKISEEIERKKQKEKFISTSIKPM